MSMLPMPPEFDAGKVLSAWLAAAGAAYLISNSVKRLMRVLKGL